MDDTRLTDADLDRVNQYLKSPVHQTTRKPFNGWLLLSIIMFVLGLLTLLSFWLALA